MAVKNLKRGESKSSSILKLIILKPRFIFKQCNKIKYFQIEEDIRIVEKIYYDPFEKDDEKIQDVNFSFFDEKFNARKKLKKVEEKLMEKQVKLDKTSKKLDHLRGAYKSVWFDLGHLKNQKNELEVKKHEIIKFKIHI